MEGISKIVETVRLPVNIEIYPYMRDHCFEGRVVYPAVEAMEVLAETAKGFRPDTDILGMADIRFEKFLYIQQDTKQVAAFCDISIHENDDITALLQTKSRSQKSSISRTKEHAAIRFSRQARDLQKPPLDLITALDGTCLEVPADKIYRDLIPFGPAYHNIRNRLFISKDGTIGWTHAPPNSSETDNGNRLGSPFVLDAAFHAACAWGQRYAGIVAFPMGIEKRVIFNRTRPGKAYISRILPVKMTPDSLVFDIWIYDGKGNLFEGACGVAMRDVSGGRMKPPRRIINNREHHPLERIKNHCRALSVIELETVMSFAEKTLSDHEKKRLKTMGDKRKCSYLAARLACKRLSRKLSGNDTITPASALTTVCADRVRPCCPLTDGSLTSLCSVSHDDRFTVAVASDSRVGVDVERISKRVLKAQHLYMDETELALLRESQLEEIEAAVRIWSIKEAVAKILDINLAESWNRVHVGAVNPHESSFQIDGKKPCIAVHDVVGRHVFTLVWRLNER